MDPCEGSSSRSQKRQRLNVNSSTNEYTSYQWTSSSSSHDTGIIYDVFISFRGPDSRNKFLSHLVNALRRKQLQVFVDDNLKEGNEIFKGLSEAIEKSQISLVIFSKDYASSKSCLYELVKINECKEKNGQIVVPIFYEVDPSDVKFQKGCFQDSFARHEKRYKVNTMKWRTTMKEVANLSGFHDKNFRNEAELIDVIVQRVVTRLKIMHQVEIKGLVGIDNPCAYLQSLISCIEWEKVGVIGIWGMGGLGKTTIARELFKRMCSEFDGCCFLENVREQLEKHGVAHVKREMFSILLEENDRNIDISSGVPDHVWRLKRKKILIVLDDISHPEQFSQLIGERDWLGPGSRIVVTTRDKHVIEKEANHIYKVQALTSHYALELLKLHAFDEKQPKMNWHDKLMLKVLEYAKGIPLALKVLGRLLYGSNEEEWTSHLEKLEQMPSADIQNVLKLSYEGLDSDQKKIFLCLSCFFKDNDNDRNVKELLDASCGRNISCDLKTLENKALITISRGWYDKVERVTMHDLIREMGRSIDNSGKRKHWSDHREILRVLEDGQGSEHIESMTLKMSKIGDEDRDLSPNCFAKMSNMEFLKFHSSFIPHIPNRLHLPEGLGKISSGLRLFHWDDYPCESLPMRFNVENLVEFSMHRSRLKKLWSGKQNLPKLKIINIQASDLVEIPDLSRASSLEDLLLCSTNIASVHPSVFCHQNVKRVWLSNCLSLQELPAIEVMPSLTELYLSRCFHLKRLPDSMSNLTSLEYLDLSDCFELITPNPNIFDGLHSLKHLCLDRCWKVNNLTENINQLTSLKNLSLKETNVESLPESIRYLWQLESLYLDGCRKLQSIPELPPFLREFSANGCESLESVFIPTSEHITWAAENGPYEYETTFSLWGCPKLGKDILEKLEKYVNSFNNEKMRLWCFDMGHEFDESMYSNVKIHSDGEIESDEEIF